ncbi:MAG: glycosyltransferase [Rhodospirillaceae bacterium]|nr:glycosyltransferase [Rhodospirillaceae bacterium]
MPSILFVNRVFPPDPGATGRLAADAARHLHGQGWDVAVLCCGPTDAADVHHGVDVRRAAAPQGQSWRDTLEQISALARGVAQLPPADVTVLMSDPPLLGLVGRLVKARGGVSIHWLQDLYPDLFDLVAPGEAPSAAVLRQAGRAALASHDRILAIDVAMLEPLAAYGVPRHRVAVVPNWADAWADGGRPAWPTAMPIAMPTAMPTARQGLHVVHAGSLGRAHDTAGLLDAAARLAADRTAIRFTFAGGGSARHRFDAAVRARGLADRVACRPWLADAALARLIRSADLALAVLDRRAAGMALPCKAHLALALGRPVVFCGPPGTGLAALLRDSGAGLWLPPGDGAALARTLAHLAADPAAMQRLAAGAAAVAPSQAHAAGVARFHGAVRDALGVTAAADALVQVPPALAALAGQDLGLCRP